MYFQASHNFVYYKGTSGFLMPLGMIKRQSPANFRTDSKYLEIQSIKISHLRLFYVAKHLKIHL